MSLLPKVLIVDDEPIIRRILDEVLALEGYPCEGVANGKEALDLLARDSSSRVILLDLMMPVIGGREFMETLKAIPGGRAKHVIVLMSAIGNLVHDAGLGADGTLPKPFNFSDLLTILDISVYLLQSLSQPDQDKVEVLLMHQQVGQ